MCIHTPNDNFNPFAGSSGTKLLADITDADNNKSEESKGTDSNNKKNR